MWSVSISKNSDSGKIVDQCWIQNSRDEGHQPVADLRGGGVRDGRPPGRPNSFNLMQFLGEFGNHYYAFTALLAAQPSAQTQG